MKNSNFFWSRFETYYITYIIFLFIFTKKSMKMVIKLHYQNYRNCVKYLHIINSKVIFNESRSIPVSITSMYNFISEKSRVCYFRNTFIDFNYKNIYVYVKRAQSVKHEVSLTYHQRRRIQPALYDWPEFKISVHSHPCVIKSSRNRARVQWLIKHARRILCV